MYLFGKCHAIELNTKALPIGGNFVVRRIQSYVVIFYQIIKSNTYMAT